jgi:hypothetical protein
VLVDDAQRHAVGADEQRRVGEQADVLAVAKVPQSGRRRVGGEVEQRRVLHDEHRSWRGREAVDGGGAVGGADGAGIDARVVPEPVGGLGRGPANGRLGDGRLGAGGQVGDEADEAPVEAVIAEVGVPQFVVGPGVKRSVCHEQLEPRDRLTGSGLVGNA